MTATHERLGFTLMGLGLMRLLQDAKRFDEAHEALCALENGFKRSAEKSPKATQTSSRARPSKLRVFAA
jgi:hypothetical protein